MSTDGWTGTLWSAPAMEYHSALTRKETRTHATMRMNLQDIMSEINLSEKDSFCLIPLLSGA